jgi:UDP-glucose 4-epimerase
MKVLVTGGAGFIGSHLSESLLDDGHEVYVLDDLSTGSVSNVAHLVGDGRFHLIVDSVLNPAVVAELVYKADHVYHLAAAVGVRLIVERPVDTLRINLDGTQTVLDYCARYNRRVLVASTSEVYGDHRSRTPLAETAQRIYGSTTARRWAYADSKAMDEFLALAYHDERDLDTVIVRLFNTVGPRQSGEYGMVIPRFVQAALAQRRLEIHGDGSQTRCFCHVDDVVAALRRLMEVFPSSGEIFNVGGTTSTSVLELAHLVCEMAGAEARFSFVPYENVYGVGIEDMLHRVPCIDKINGVIGWNPTRALEEILQDVINYQTTTEVRAA